MQLPAFVVLASSAVAQRIPRHLPTPEGFPPSGPPATDSAVFDDHCPEGSVPGQDWADVTEVARQQAPEQVDALHDYLFPVDLDWKDDDRRGVRTDGIVVVRGGEILYEAYDHGFDRDTRHLAWSVTKTVLGTLTGIASYHGLLSVDDSICEHYEPPADADRDAVCAITIQALLEWSSGFDWNETYEGESPTTSSVIAMLYGEGTTDMAAFVARHPTRAEPLAVHQYSSGDSNLLSAVVGEAMKPKFGVDFAHEVLFDRLGMTQTLIERDGAGTHVASSYWYATPRDMARLGLLWLHDGCWDGKRLMASQWIEQSLQPATAFVTDGEARVLDWKPGDSVPGRHVWLNLAAPQHGAPERPWPAAPDDAFAALGHWKQMIIVVPSLDLVVVRTGDDRDGESFDRSEMLARVIALSNALSPPSVDLDPPRQAPIP